MFKELFFDTLYLFGILMLINIIFELVMMPFKKIQDYKMRNKLEENFDEILKNAKTEIISIDKKKDKK